MNTIYKSELWARYKAGKLGGLLNIAIECDPEREIENYNIEFGGYCAQNNGSCSACSLSSYGRDCHNNLL